MKKYLTILLVFSLFTLTGCGNKTALTADEIKDKVESIGFEVTDVKSNYDGMEYVTNALKIGDGNFSVDYLEISDVETAKTIFQNNKEGIDTYINGNYTNRSSSGNNYETYELTSDGYYNYISRVDNTIIHTSNKIEYEEEMKQIIKALKY